MTPEERQLLTGLFERTKTVQTGPRDAEAESLIAESVRAQPHAPYLLAQTVLVQEQALRAASDRLQELEAKVHSLESQGGGSTSFLGGIGKSLFGGGEPARPSEPVPAPSPWSRSGGAPQGGAPGYYNAPPPAGGPWQQQPQPQQGGMGLGGMTGGGGGFLKGALGAAAGVAGGVLLADSMRGLFSHGNNSLGIAGGSQNGLGAAGGGETIVNNYYGSDGPGFDQAGNFDGADPRDTSSGYDTAGYDDSSNTYDDGSTDV